MPRELKSYPLKILINVIKESILQLCPVLFPPKILGKFSQIKKEKGEGAIIKSVGHLCGTQPTCTESLESQVIS